MAEDNYKTSLRKMWDNNQNQIVGNMRAGDNFNPWLHIKQTALNVPLTALENQGSPNMSGFHGDEGNKRLQDAEKAERDAEAYAKRMGR